MQVVQSCQDAAHYLPGLGLLVSFLLHNPIEQIASMEQFHHQVHGLIGRHKDIGKLDNIGVVQSLKNCSLGLDGGIGHL